MTGRSPILADIATCIGFYTRLPAPGGDHTRFAAAQWAAPLAGLIVALVTAIVYTLALRLGLPPSIAAILAIAAAMLATGSLHEDGLADTADGFGGGRTPERRLEIMRDSRIGTHGAAALAFSILIRVAALAHLGRPGAVFAALVAAHMASRALMPAMMHVMAPARRDGLSAMAGTIGRDTALVALVLGAIGLLFIGFWAGIVAAALLGMLLLVMRRTCERMIGGQTGDTLGALQQLAEIAVLLVAAATI